MNYKIREEEAIGESIRRIACEQIDAAIDASRSARNGKGTPVHQTRKHLKKARAAVRLLATEVNGKRFQREERRLRNVGRLISDIRDAEVRLETIKQLRNGLDRTRAKTFAETEELFAFELDSFLAAFSGWQEQASGELRHARAGVAQWHLHKLTRGRICRALRKSYRKGREALKCVEEKGSAKRFHELRKRAKELWYQLRLLRPLEPEVFRELSDELETLGEQLGHAHDLYFVAERLRSIGARNRGNRALRLLVDSREKELLRSACALGQHFYASTPKKFSAHIAIFFQERQPAKAPQIRRVPSALINQRNRGRTRLTKRDD